MWSYSVLLLALIGVIAGQNTTTHAPSPDTTAAVPSTLAPATTSKPNVTTTTAAPSSSTTTTTTTTTIAPPTTPAPHGPPKNSYNVTFSNGTVCILMEAVMQVKISYLSQNESKEAMIPFDEFASVNRALSTCHGPNDTQVLAIDFAGDDTVSFVFRKNSTVFVSNITLNYTQDSKHFPDSDTPGRKDSVQSEQLFLFSVLPGRSYLCNRDGPLTLSKNVTLDVVSVQLQAFLTNDTGLTGEFGTATECSSGDISNVIPIAVGVALAALVLIVLIAYLVGRRWSRQKGYHSV